MTALPASQVTTSAVATLKGATGVGAEASACVLFLGGAYAAVRYGVAARGVVSRRPASAHAASLGGASGVEPPADPGPRRDLSAASTACSPPTTAAR
jgi:hypothetical protein